LMFQSWLDAEGQSSGKPDVPVALAG